MPHRRAVAVIGGLALAGSALAACSAEEHRTSITVFAAASLAASFDDIAEGFEGGHADIDVEPIVYDGSSTLATQIAEGAAPDVFASADEANMTAVDEFTETPEIFAENTLVIAVPQGNPAGIETLADLPGATVVTCAAEVPCGSASVRLLDLAGVELEPASLEQNVTAVLTKVSTGDADAGLVYATDAAGDDTVEAIVPEHADEVVNRYPVAALSGSDSPDAASAFVDYVTGAEGQQVLADHGFGAP
ncbi:molybdate ABC transporter substrate-binding protein [Microbacterium gubbeenense]|uniref:molybdate ABC transporter substrate-binding protein n=1 Tax=Microbacterium gubbeenense TaxID=159896 RepID=UPI003F979C02